MTGLEDRLCREFAPDDGAGACVVRGYVRQVRSGFGLPRVMAFLPVLVEHDVRGHLRKAASIERSTS